MIVIKKRGRKISSVCLVMSILFISLSDVVQISATETKNLTLNEILLLDDTDVVYVDDVPSDEEILKETEKRENEAIQASNMVTRSGVYYDVKLVAVDTDYEWTGFRVAGGQPAGGVNFGSKGGSFGYKDGNAYNPISISFGISAYGFSLSVGVGQKVNPGVTGYNIVAPKNKFVRLRVNRRVKVVTYKRYKVYRHNGYQEPYGYTHSDPITYQLQFDATRP